MGTCQASPTVHSLSSTALLCYIPVPLWRVREVVVCSCYHIIIHDTSSPIPSHPRTTCYESLKARARAIWLHLAYCDSHCAPFEASKCTHLNNIVMMQEPLKVNMNGKPRNIYLKRNTILVVLSVKECFFNLVTLMVLLDLICDQTKGGKYAY